MRLTDIFAMTRIVNLPHRTDRRREMEDELRQSGITAGTDGVEFFPAIRPADPGNFPTVGIRGCFLSHHTILREAMEAGVESVLVLEDDLQISKDLGRVLPFIREQLANEQWGMTYFGYTGDLGDVEAEADRPLLQTKELLGCTHFYAVHRRALPRLVTFLDELLKRAPGSVLPGPMHVDGALFRFRLANPDVITFAAYPCLGFQRSSKSDLFEQWYERIPILKQASSLARTAQTWLRIRMRQIDPA